MGCTAEREGLNLRCSGILARAIYLSYLDTLPSDRRQ